MKTVGLLIFTGAIATIVAVRYRWLLAIRDKEWKRRWRALPKRERLRIAAAVRRGEKLDDPAEAELAAGSARFQRDVVYGGMSVGPMMQPAVAGIALLGGLLSGSVALIVFGLALVAFDGWRMWSNRTRRETLTRAAELNEEASSE